MLDAMLSFFWPEAMAGLTYADNEWDPSSKGAAMDLVFEASDGYITLVLFRIKSGSVCADRLIERI